MGPLECILLWSGHRRLKALQVMDLRRKITVQWEFFYFIVHWDEEKGQRQSNTSIAAWKVAVSVEVTAGKHLTVVIVALLSSVTWLWWELRSWSNGLREYYEMKGPLVWIKLQSVKMENIFPYIWPLEASETSNNIFPNCFWVLHSYNIFFLGSLDNLKTASSCEIVWRRYRMYMYIYIFFS